MRWLGLTLVLGFLAAPVFGQVAINEIRIDQPSSDDDEYVELFLAGGGSLAGHTYLVIGDTNAGSSGVIEAVVDLNLQTIPADGFFLIAEATYTLAGTPDLVTNINFENSDNVTHYLVTGFTGSDGDDLDTNDDGVLDVLPWTTVVDKIALVEEANPPVNTEYHYGPPQIGPDAGFVPAHIYRNPDGSGAWNVGQFELAGGADTPGTSNTAFPPPDAVGKFTTTALNTASSAITLCAAGQNTPITSVITGLPANGTLSDGTGVINSVPHDVVGNLIYTPNGGFSGLDSFDFNARDAIGQTDDTDATQEVGVQTGDVFISEIMHQPTGNDDVFEFVEIYNAGVSAVSLTRLDARSAGDGNEKDTTDNLLGASIPAGTVRILAPEDATAPSGATDFRCEWELDENIIIRVPIDAWEALFESADTDCFASQGSRVLVFGTGGTLLDAVDMSIQLADCLAGQAGSYSLDPQGLPFPNNITNDVPIRWACAGDFDPGEQRIGTVGLDPSTITSVHFEKPAFETPVPCVRGACCTRGGGCVEDLFLEECLEITCQSVSDGLNLWNADMTCDEVSCSVLQTPQKCCLPGPAGLCANLTDCECTRVEGNADSGTCESNPGCIPSDGVTFNELDYDQDGTDELEFLELFGTANFDLSGWTVEFHNGNASTNGPTLVAARTLILDAEPGGGTIPNDGGGVGYLVIGDFGVANLDVDLCDPAGVGCSNRIENGGSGANGNGDAIVLLNNGVVVEAISYDTGTTGFFARGGGADGIFLPDIGLVDEPFGGLQRLPDGQTWTLTPNITPGESNAIGGACCSGIDGFTCDITLPGDCLGTYQGNGTFCDPVNPCIPRGSCCLPDGTCLDDVSSNACELQGGQWNGEDSLCPDIEGFVACVSGPGTSAGPACSPFDLSDSDSDVDLRDYWVFQREGGFCEADPSGACCRVDGVCVIATQFDCEAFAGIYQGDGVSCDPDPGCVPVAGNVLLNEILANNDGLDTNEFIELFGTPSASLDGLSVIVVDGDTGGDPGSTVLRRVNLWLDLTGLSLDANGYLVIGTGPSVPADVAMESIAVLGSNSNGVPDELQNGSQTYAIVSTADVAVDGVQLTLASEVAINANAIDTVATLDGSSGDVSYFGAPVVISDSGFALAYGHRIPNGTDTNTAGDWEAISAVEFGDINSPTVPTFGSANVALTGACCDGATCSQTTKAGCAFSFFGFNVPCTPNPCVGACCSPALTCTETVESACVGPDAFLGGGSTCSPNPCVACTDLATAESNADGTAVCITNVQVSRLFDSVSSTNVASFWVQDTTGTNGITVFAGTTEINDLIAGVNRGDIVEMRGELGTFFQTRQLQEGVNPLTLTVLSTGNTVTPIDRTIGSLPATATEFDDINNVLVRLTNVQFAAVDQGDNFASGVNYTINDATTPSDTLVLRINNTNNEPPIVGTQIPFGTVDIVGIMSTFSGAYQIFPFEPADIETP
jgi:hypothetical protein